MKTQWLKRVMPRLLVVGVILAILIIPLIPISVHADATPDHYLKATGNWANAATWSDTDGGAAGATFPVAGDNVYITANGNGLTLTVAVAAACASLICSGASTATVTLTNWLTVTGDITTVSNMTISGNGFLPSGTGLTNINTGGLSWAGIGIYQKKTGAGSVVLQSMLRIGYYSLDTGGTFNTNGQTVGNVGDNTDLNISGATAKTITFGNSIVNIRDWADTGTNLTVTPNTATINISRNLTSVNIATYNIVNLTGATSTISGSNTFAKLSFKPAAGQTITFTDTTTQTAASFERTGTGQIVFQGSAAGGWALTDSDGGTNTFNNLTVSRCTASGATFNATGASLNSGNNVGWTFPTTLTTQSTTITPNSTTATLNGTTTDQGGSAIIERGFAWNTSGLPVIAEHKIVVAGTLGVYSGNITGLSPNNIYYIRSYLTNGSGTSYGNEQVFTTFLVNQSSNLGYWGIPLAFLLLGLLLILSFNFEALGTDGIKNLVYIAIVVFLLFAFLVSMQPGLNALP
jgi:hypothetical protein